MWTHIKTIVTYNALIMIVMIAMGHAQTSVSESKDKIKVNY